MKAIELRNVVTSDEVSANIKARTPAGHTATFQVHRVLEKVVLTLATLKPTWRFEARNANREHVHDSIGNDTKEVRFHFTEFAVYEDGEMLGHFRKDYGRSGEKILVHNERIMKGRERGNGYTTEKADKAIAKIKREFVRLSYKERVDKAEKEAGEYISNALYQHRGKAKDYLRRVEGLAYAWVLDKGFELFVAHMKNELPAHEYDAVLDAKRNADNFNMEVGVLENIRKRFGSKESALVIRDAGKYIVRIGDKVELHDDVTLPEALRGRLGMLKLVEKENFIENTGCRVSDEVFLVVLDPANNVTEE